MTPFDAHVLREIHDDRIRRLNAQRDPARRYATPTRRRAPR